MFDLMPYIAIFVAGFLGSVHCIGMCGGFACALCATHTRGVVRRQMIYNLGRVTSYIFLGMLAGTAGALFIHNGTTWGHGTQQLLSVFSATLIILIALQFFGYRLGGHLGRVSLIIDSLASGLRGVASSPQTGAALALGVVNGFLPCPLVYAFVLQAATSGGGLPGMAVMAVFGLGTFPAMLLMGLGGAALGPRLRRAQVAGTLLLLLGFITLARALLPMSLHGMHT